MSGTNGQRVENAHETEMISEEVGVGVDWGISDEDDGDGDWSDEVDEVITSVFVDVMTVVDELPSELVREDVEASSVDEVVGERARDVEGKTESVADGVPETVDEVDPSLASDMSLAWA